MSPKILTALAALTVATQAFAAPPTAPAPKPECSCCKGDKPMACCAEHKKEKGDHGGHEEMSHE